MDLKVLWTISGSMGTVGDIKMLKSAEGFKIDVVTADRTDKDCAGFVITGKKHIVPGGSEPGYIAGIIDICKDEGITTIIPQYGDELVSLSHNIELFNKMGIKVLVTEDEERLKIANNKRDLYDFLRSREYIPSYRYVESKEALEKSLFDLGYPTVPVCLKPAFGEGGRGFKIITEERVDIFNDEPGVTKLNLEALQQGVKTLEDMPELIAMEYLPGREYSVDCICSRGDAVLCIPRQRIETSMGAASVSLIEKNDEIIEISKEIISKLNLSYNVNIQFKYDRFGRPKLIEVNPRVSGSLIANLGAGVNMLELSLKLAYGMPLGKIDVKWGTRMIRYWNQIYIK